MSKTITHLKQQIRRLELKHARRRVRPEVSTIRSFDASDMSEQELARLDAVVFGERNRSPEVVK